MADPHVDQRLSRKRHTIYVADNIIKCPTSEPFLAVLPMTSKPLTARQLEAFKLRSEEGLTFRQIADRLGVTVRAAYEAVKCAEKKLDHKKLPIRKPASPAERAQDKRAEGDKAVEDMKPADVLNLMEDRLRAPHRQGDAGRFAGGAWPWSYPAATPTL